MIPFEWKVPTLGKPLKWLPLKAQVALDESIASAKMNAAARDKQLALRRIVFYDTHDGPPSAVEFADWDEVDYELFLDEILEKENARKAMLRKKQIPEGVNPADDLRGALQDLILSLAEVQRTATVALEAQAVVEAASDPLERKST